MDLGWLGDLLGLNKGNATVDAANQNKSLISGLNGQVGDLITSGANTTNDYLTKALGLTDLGPGANGLLGDALGTGGATGSARALSAFQTDPGYQFQMDQGQQAIDRSAAARGQFQGGQTPLDELKFSQGIANQGWQQWLQNLTGGIKGNTASLGDLASANDAQTGQRINLAGDIGNATMGANNQVAAGREANQGSLIGLFDNVAGIAGSAFGLNKNPAGGTASAAATPTFGGYGRGW